MNRRRPITARAPKIVFPATPGARNWHPASFDPVSGLYYAAVLDMGNLIFTTPGQKPYARQMLNNDAALIFGPDIEAALPSLPPPMQAACRRCRRWRGQAQAVRLGAARDRSADRTDALGGAGQGLAGPRRCLDDGERSRVPGQHRRHVPRVRPARREAAQVHRHGCVDIGRTDDVSRERCAIRRGDGSVGRRRLSVRAALRSRVHTRQPGQDPRVQLGGGAVPLPPELPSLQVAPAPPAQQPGVTAATLERGRALFFGNCVLCHSNQHRSITPDLRRMPLGAHSAFRNIVLDGALLANGMPRWDDRLSAGDVDDIHAYLIDLQARTRADELDKQKSGVPLDTPSLAILSNY
jgi:quinohemoprotein ethanol dehydrogenase